MDSYDWITQTAAAHAGELLRITSRLGLPIVELSGSNESEISDSIVTALMGGSADKLSPALLESCLKVTKSLKSDSGLVALPLSPTSTLVFWGMRSESGGRMRLACLIPANPEVARCLVSAACEATHLETQAASLRQELSLSQQRISQNFEEQCWLRDLARNMSISAETTNANMAAQGMLKPLVDLLHSEELFLVVREEEVARSGLTSCNYGKQLIGLPEMVQLMPSLLQIKPTGPIVLNNQRLLEGRIRSVLAVPVLSYDRPLGYIVAVNRLPGGPTDNSTEPQFGSLEVGLMEEASVLLSTQTHNIRLILDSQHLALGTLQAMSRAIDARDPYTSGHSERVARLAFELAEILGLEEPACQEIYVAGILHDVGKIGIPDRVLLKAGALTDEEYDIIKQHPEIGYRIVEQLGKLQFTLPGVLYHHERWDGRGYPQGLAGDDIPLMARIIAVADSFDAMTSSRPYRNAMPLAQAFEIIQQGSGHQFDAMLVRCFEHWRKERMNALPQLPPHGVSLIPQEPPYADITQSVLALQM